MKARAKYKKTSQQSRFVSNPMEQEIAQGFDIGFVSNNIEPQLESFMPPQPIAAKPKPRNNRGGLKQDSPSLPGTYEKQEIWWSRVTVREGERLAIWSIDGTIEIIDGPARPLLYKKTIEYLRQFHADSQHYLIVKYRDGTKKHLPGPVSLFFHPVEHASITVSHSINLNNDEAMVVYQQLLDKGDNSSKIERKVVKGPALYTPSSSEWVQEFLWGQGEDSEPSDDQGQAKLKLVPEQMFIDVDNVRTTDDALLTLNFMIVFQLHDIEKMLAETHDPIADFTTAMCSDVITFSSKLTFEAFKGFTDQLNDLSTYSNLLSRAKIDGFRIVNVVFRGYQPTAALKAMQERNVEVRTKLQLESETEEQKEKLLSFKQHAKFERDRERHEMELMEKEHILSMEQKAMDERIRQNRQAFESRLAEERESHALQAEFAQQKMNQELFFFKELHENLKVDLTKYLIARSEPTPSQFIRVKSDSSEAAAVHLHP